MKGNAGHHEGFTFSRRRFLNKLRWIPLSCVPARLLVLFPELGRTSPVSEQISSPALDFRLTPHYPAASPFDAIISKVEAGKDEFITEKYAEEIEKALGVWGESLRRTPPDIRAIAGLLTVSLSAASFHPMDSEPLRPDGTLQVFRNRFWGNFSLDREAFVGEVCESFDHFKQFLVTEFEVTSLIITSTLPLSVRTLIRYDLLGSGSNVHREGRVGYWEIEWRANSAGNFLAAKWRTSRKH